MADNFTDFYTGNMAPPLRLPGGGYAPAPSMQQQMTPEQIYEGIYGEPISTGLSSRSVRTVAIDPTTGMPPRPQVATNPLPQSPAPSPLPMLANQPSGTVVAGKDQSRLTPNVFGYGTNGPTGNAATAAIDGATAKTGLQQVPYGVYMNNRSRDSVEYAQQGRNDLFKMLERQQQQQGDGILDLTRLTGMSEKGAQGIADSEGKPIRAANGKVYYPGGRAPQAAQGRTGAAAAAQQSQQRFGGLGGLLSGLFGGGQAAQPQQGGGGLGALLSGSGSASPGYVTTPFQENAFQTTTGAVMPASMSNSRWLTGY